MHNVVLYMYIYVLCYMCFTLSILLIMTENTFLAIARSMFVSAYHFFMGSLPKHKNLGCYLLRLTRIDSACLIIDRVSIVHSSVCCSILQARMSLHKLRGTASVEVELDAIRSAVAAQKVIHGKLYIHTL